MKIDSIYEPIEHEEMLPANIFITSIDSSHFHWHYDYELLLILKGNLTVFCGSNPIQMKDGDLFMINSKVIHGFKGDGDNICLFIQLSDKLLKPLIREEQVFHFYLNSTSDSMIPKVGYEHFVQLAAKIGLANSHPERSAAFRTMSVIQQLIADLLDYVQYDIRRYPLSHEFSSEDDFAAKVGAYISLNCDKYNIVEDVCEHFAISEKTLYRYIKNAFGLSPKELVVKMRMERAKAMLRNSRISVSLVGEKCGFSSEVTFHRVFKRETGLTPKAYRTEENKSLVGKDIQGYLSFDSNEGKDLMIHYSKNTDS